MEPTLTNGELIVVSKEPTLQRGHLVFFEKPSSWTAAKEEHSLLVKRVVGLPGDKLTYAKRTFTVNGQAYPLPEGYDCTATAYSTTIPSGYYFFLGDNGPASLDSRYMLCHGRANESLVLASAVRSHGRLLKGIKE